MRTAIAIIAVLVGLAASAYAWHIHNQPRLPYFEPHHETERNGVACAAWSVEQFTVVLCDGGVFVLYPKKQHSYSS